MNERKKEQPQPRQEEEPVSKRSGMKDQMDMDVQEGNLEYDEEDPHGLKSRTTDHDRQGKTPGKEN